MKSLFRSFIVMLVCLGIFSACARQTLAQTSQTDLSQYTNAGTNPDVPKDLHSLTQIVTMEVVSTMICQLSGMDITMSNHQCLGLDPQTHRIGFVHGGRGVIGMVSQGIMLTLNFPVHTSDYVHYLANNFGVNKTYAQTPAGTGTGFVGMYPLLKLWTAFRNITYLFLTIIFVLIGIAIMLRVQIDPRTVMTIENQLPKIVICLILVTFSYAIAGVMIDVMWVFIFFLINVLVSADPGYSTDVGNRATQALLNGPLLYINELFTGVQGGGVGSGFWTLGGAAAHAIGDALGASWTQNNVQQLGINPPGADANGGCSVWDWLGVGSNSVLKCVGKTIGIDLNIGDYIAYIVGWILGALGGLIVLIAILITMFRVWMMLLMEFAFWILDIILAGPYIAAGLIPGSQIGFGSWFKSIAQHVLVFITVVFMFVLARVLMDSFGDPNGNGKALFEPPLIGSVVGSGGGNPLGVLVALAIIFATPSVADMIKKALQTIDLGLGQTALQNVGSGHSTLGKVGGHVGGSITAYTYKMPNPNQRAGWQGVLGRFFR